MRYRRGPSEGQGDGDEERASVAGGPSAVVATEGPPAALDSVQGHLEETRHATPGDQHLEDLGVKHQPMPESWPCPGRGCISHAVDHLHCADERSHRGSPQEEMLVAGHGVDVERPGGMDDELTPIARRPSAVLYVFDSVDDKVR